MKDNNLGMLTNNTVIENIAKAAMQNVTVTISYKDNKGVITSRETEPYEIKNGSYWGYCVLKNGIRQFKLESIVSATPTNNKYFPRWPVKIQ